MARPKSPEKRKAIVDSAVRAIAQAGLSASTAAIAKGAGIAEGTLFTYFASKDELCNALYLELKSETYARINAGFPHGARLRERARHIWTQALAWAIERPEARKASMQLNLSEIITAETRGRLVGDRQAVDEAMGEVSRRGAFEGMPAGFASSVMSALQQAVLETIAGHPKERSALVEAGFDAFWRMSK